MPFLALETTQERLRVSVHVLKEISYLKRNPLHRLRRSVSKLPGKSVLFSTWPIPVAKATPMQRDSIVSSSILAFN